MMSGKFVAALGVFALVVASSGTAGAASCMGKTTSCRCGSPTPSVVSFTSTVGSGTCGDVKDDSATTLTTLDCSKLYIGGGGAGAVPPGTVPDNGTTKLKVSCCRGSSLFLNATSATDTGSNRDCSSAACLYGPPLPVPNTGIPGLSSCVINEVATDAAGVSSCAAGSANINIPLTSHVFLKGDMLPKRCGPGTTNPDNVGRRCTMDSDCGAMAAAGSCVDDSAHLQPCPICNPSTHKCNGGPNDVPGMPAVGCTPGTVASSGDAFPVSHDCPPAPPSEAPLANLAIPFQLTTGAATKTSTDLTGQSFVFCGFCGSASSPTFHNPPVPCTSDANCAGLTGCPNTTACGTCKQRNPGAFGQGPARTITENGMPAGRLTTGSSASAKLASVFCIPPTFAAGGLVDGSSDLPGPGAVAFPVTLSLP